MLTKVIKRDGRKETFDAARVYEAVRKAAVNDCGRDSFQANDIAEAVAGEVSQQCLSSKKVSVEEIQDMVEHALMNVDKEVAKQYILYRKRRSDVREAKTSLMNLFDDFTKKSSLEVNESRENANINADAPMGVMLKYGSTAAKDYNCKKVLAPEFSKAHLDGDIHIHDLDFYSITLNCCQINLEKLFRHGFSTGHGFLREPNSIGSYASLACIAIQSNQNDMFGGQSVPAFDYYMAPGVAKTYISELCKVVEDVRTPDNEVLDAFKDGLRSYAAGSGWHILNAEGKGIVGQRLRDVFGMGSDEAERVMGMALKRTDRATYQAMEACVHNLNTLHSRAGAQVPFSSLNYGTDTSEEGRMVTKNLLLATEAGLGNGETCIFPVSIFKVKKGVSLNDGDPNGDLFKLACRVSAKRLFPNFSFMDAPFNAQYALPDGSPEGEIGYMGCSKGTEIITYKVRDYLNVEGISRAFSKLAMFHHVQKHGVSEYIDLEDEDVRIYDSNAGGFVKVRKIIKNPNKNNWKLIQFSDGRNLTLTEDHYLPVEGKGRTRVGDLAVGDEVRRISTQYSEECVQQEADLAWLLGLLLCDGTYDTTVVLSIGPDELDIYEKVKRVSESMGFSVALTEQDRGERGHYFDVRINTGAFRAAKNQLTELYGGLRKAERHVPNVVFSWNREAKMAFFAGMLDADGHIHVSNGRCNISAGSTNQELATQQMLLGQALGFIGKLYRNHYKNCNAGKIRHVVTLTSATKDLYDELRSYMACGKKKEALATFDGIGSKTGDLCKVVSISSYHLEECSYDVETASDMFDLSGVCSHNCRTRVISNVYDTSRQTTSGRGNLSFTSINLPRLGIEAHGDTGKFFDSLRSIMELVTRQLIERFEIQRRRHAYNFPFLIGEGVWMDSDSLKPSSELGDILKHGTLSYGFIGLAECLKALIGKHHGESADAQELGLRIVKFMDDFAKQKTKELGLNFTLIASPAEGLSGRFVRIDKKKYGVIPGVTDRDYYTNSFHVPVYHRIGIKEKIDLEAPYHALTPAGHITYVEVDGDPSQNLPAFESIIRYMASAGIGYGSINHPVDRDPVCGYTGIIGDVCPRCGRHDGEGISPEHYEELRLKYKLPPLEE